MNILEMRKAFAKYMIEMMQEDETVILMDADLAGANNTGEIMKAFPKRAFDMGIQEANMASAAAGMAAYGMKPYIVTFSPFATRRICDQIAISICYARQKVVIVGTDPGISAELNGATHMSMEDMGSLRSIPDMAIVTIADSNQLKSLLPQINAYEKPIYMRMVRKNAEIVYDPDYKSVLFKADVLKEGSDVTLFCEGILINDTLKAAKMLEEKGINAEVIGFNSIKPIDKEAIIKSLKKTNCAVTVENHNVIGGLRSAVVEVSSEEYPCLIYPIGVKDHFGEVGNVAFLKEKYNMEAKDIVESALKVIQNKK